MNVIQNDGVCVNYKQAKLKVHAIKMLQIATTNTHRIKLLLKKYMIERTEPFLARVQNHPPSLSALTLISCHRFDKVFDMINAML